MLSQNISSTPSLSQFLRLRDSWVCRKHTSLKSHLSHETPHQVGRVLVTCFWHKVILKFSSMVFDINETVPSPNLTKIGQIPSISFLPLSAQKIFRETSHALTSPSLLIFSLYRLYSQTVFCLSSERPSWKPYIQVRCFLEQFWPLKIH